MAGMGNESELENGRVLLPSPVLDVDLAHREKKEIRIRQLLHTTPPPLSSIHLPAFSILSVSLISSLG